MRAKSLSTFIREHREALNVYIGHKLGRFASLTSSVTVDDCRQWILNDESLYLWAKSEGVRI